ncbi:MAG TPA: hypothetical protein VI547_13025 [Anaerolineales bacterium]|nr:hypothetical protein [Anaerolineales bacterium]
MATKTVRMQVDLPRAIFVRLQHRADDLGSTVAAQIQKALEEYLLRASEDDKSSKRFDPAQLLTVIDSIDEGGPSDLAEAHDKYIYGDPHGEKAAERERNRRESQTKTQPSVRESRPAYKTKKRRGSKKSKRNDAKP